MEKVYTIFAGVNGAGKTTLYKVNEKATAGQKRVNSDEILRENKGDWRNNGDQVKAMNFPQGCIIHLDEDLRRLKRTKQEKVLKDKPLEIIHISELNRYNQSKTKELKIIAVATVALMLASVFSSIYL